ncbi:MAG TPA: Crp/Fnr family transcriptional regulator [Polyangiaceae bacterium]|jgi:CRP-like cAMP-binding protein|nr:Crp/Fnr family transcriptional regulator [Polyangiaceae bacterium]
MASSPSEQPNQRRHQQCSFEPGELIYEQGGPADLAFFVESGRIRIFTRIGGLERNLRVVGAGDVFGESALSPPATHDATAICVDRAVAIAFDAGSLPGLVREAPSVGSRLVLCLAERARLAEERIEIGMLRDGQLRVVVGLLKAARSPNGSESDKVTLGLTPLELSARVGLDVTAVKRAVQQLREAQYLQIVDERLTIVDVDALHQLRGLLEMGEEIQGGDRR